MQWLSNGDRNLMRNLQQELTDSLTVLSEFDDDYIEISNVKTVIGLTSKAALFQIYYQQSDLIDKWVPRSLLRLSPDGRFFVQEWFHDKELK